MTARTGRSAVVASGTLHATDDYVRAGQGIQPVHVRAVLNGRGDEIIDLARVNLFR
jgi:hypothetical protein